VSRVRVISLLNLSLVNLDKNPPSDIKIAQLNNIKMPLVDLNKNRSIRIVNTKMEDFRQFSTLQLVKMLKLIYFELMMHFVHINFKLSDASLK